MGYINYKVPPDDGQARLDPQRTSIIVPVYNEEKTVVDVIEHLKKLPFNKEIIIIDDGSTDGTREILSNIKDLAVKIVFHETNKGKGSAIATGLKNAEGEIIAIQDADLEYDPNQLVELIKPIQDNKADVVYGSRFLKENPNIYKRYLLGNKFITWLINIFYEAHFTDSYTCYKIFRKEIIEKFNLESKRFEVEAEISIKVAKEKINFLEVPINYSPRSLEQGKKISFKEAIKGVLTILKYKFK